MLMLVLVLLPNKAKLSADFPGDQRGCKYGGGRLSRPPTVGTSAIPGLQPGSETPFVRGQRSVCPLTGRLGPPVPP